MGKRKDGQETTNIEGGKTATEWREILSSLTDRTVTGNAVGARSSCVTSSGSSKPISPSTDIFFKIKARKVLVFLFHSVVLSSIQELQWFNFCFYFLYFFFFNYLDLAFPIPHLVTVWTGMNSQSPKPICDFYGVIPNYLISAHMPVHIHSLTSFFFFPWNWAQELLVGSDVKIILKTPRPNPAQ